jgi:hypothetical protein
MSDDDPLMQEKNGAIFVKCVVFNTSCVANFPSAFFVLNIGSFITSHNFIKTACEKCGKCGNEISLIVTQVVVQINLPNVSRFHLQGLALLHTP